MLDRERIDCKLSWLMGIEGDVVSCLYENAVKSLLLYHLYSFLSSLFSVLMFQWIFSQIKSWRSYHMNSSSARSASQRSFGHNLHLLLSYSTDLWPSSYSSSVKSLLLYHLYSFLSSLFSVLMFQIVFYLISFLFFVIFSSLQLLLLFLISSIICLIVSSSISF